MTCDVVVLVPMLGRAHLVNRLAGSLAASTDRARLLFICTEGDAEVLDAVTGHDHLVMPPRSRGDYAAKINAGYRDSTEPLIFLGAIDIAFHAGWLDACQRHIDAGFGVVGTNDLGNKSTATGRLSTHTLVARDYVQRFGTADQSDTLVHEGYWHEWVDNELCDTAKARGQWAHAPDAIVEHLHPRWGKAPTDAMYEQARRRMVAGRRLYLRRRRLWQT
jgi:hypothetical protein